MLLKSVHEFKAALLLGLFPLIAVSTGASIHKASDSHDLVAIVVALFFSYAAAFLLLKGIIQAALAIKERI